MIENFAGGLVCLFVCLFVYTVGPYGHTLGSSWDQTQADCKKKKMDERNKENEPLPTIKLNCQPLDMRKNSEIFNLN